MQGPQLMQGWHVPGASGIQLLDAACEGDAAAVARLLAAGTDPNTTRSSRLATGEVIQTTALYGAAGCGRLEAARSLLDGGADPTHGTRTGGGGDTPLHPAAAKGHLAMVRLLLARGAAVDAGLGRIVALHFRSSTLYRNREHIRYLYL